MSVDTVSAGESVTLGQTFVSDLRQAVKSGLDAFNSLHVAPVVYAQATDRVIDIIAIAATRPLKFIIGPDRLITLATSPKGGHTKSVLEFDRSPAPQTVVAVVWFVLSPWLASLGGAQ